MKKPLIILAETGTGKTRFVKESRKKAFEIEVQDYVYYKAEDGEIIKRDDWPELIYNSIIKSALNTSNYKYIVLADDKEIRQVLDNNYEPYVLIHFGHDNEAKRYYRDLMEKRAMREYVSVLKKFAHSAYIDYVNLSSMPDFNYTEYFENPRRIKVISDKKAEELEGNEEFRHWFQMIKINGGKSVIDELIENWSKKHDEYKFGIDMKYCIDEIELSVGEYMSNKEVKEELDKVYKDIINKFN